MRVSPQGTEIHAIPPTERAFSLGKPSASSARGKRGALQARLTAIAFSRRTSGACTQHRLPSPAKSQRFALPVAASSSKPSRRETGGLCPHPPKGPVPWESLFGTNFRPSCVPVPQNRRRRQAPARGSAAVFPLAAPTEPKRSAEAPCSWGLGASTRSRRRWPPALPARRRQASARGPAAVCFHRCPNRTETQHPSPLLVGLGCVDPEPKALAAGTAG